jgi:hypothetical protein
VLVGDAAALVNPLTGEAHDAVAPVRYRAALLGGEAGRAPAAMRRAFGRHRSHLAVLARLAPHPRFLTPRAARDPAVFDSAVDSPCGRHRRLARPRVIAREVLPRGQRVPASGSCPSTSMLSTRLTHRVGKAPVLTPCHPMNTADGSDWATARAESSEGRTRRRRPRERRRARDGLPSRPRSATARNAIRSAATLPPNSGSRLPLRARLWIWRRDPAPAFCSR